MTDLHNVLDPLARQVHANYTIRGKATESSGFTGVQELAISSEQPNVISMDYYWYGQESISMDVPFSSAEAASDFKLFIEGYSQEPDAGFDVFIFNPSSCPVIAYSWAERISSPAEGFAELMLTRIEQNENGE